MDDLESKVSEDIDKIISKIDIDNLIVDPHLEMMGAVESIMRVLNQDFNHQAIDFGVQFAEQVNKHKDIEVVDTNNPKLNEEVFNASSQD